jgi:multidrug resistance protein MdtO
MEAFWRDQQPSPERLKCVLRIVLASVVSLIAILVWQMPHMALCLYILFFVVHDSPANCLRFNVLMLVTGTLCVLLPLGLVILTNNDPMARVLSIAAFAFVCGLGIMAGSIPFLFVGGGFVYVTIIAMWEFHVPAGALVKLCLWFIATLSVVLGSSAAVEYLFGARDPSADLQKQIAMRYRALEKFFQLYAEGAAANEWSQAVTQVAHLAAAGRTDMQALYETVVARNLDPGDLEIGTRVRITLLVQLLDLSAAFAAQPPATLDAELRRRCAALAAHCGALADGKTVEPGGEELMPKAGPHTTWLDRIEETLHEILTMPRGQHTSHDKELAALPQKKIRFIRMEDLATKEAAAFALKISLCATLCYIFYFAVDWPGISTCCGTVLIVGLTNSGAMKQKFLYRFVGSTLGGALGLAVESFLLPNIDSLTPIVLILASVVFLTGWIAQGRRFSYIGMQMCFSFYLVAFSVPHAPTALAPARDRLIGILIALVLMWFVFDQLWPVRTITLMRRAAASALQNTSGLFQLSQDYPKRAALLRQSDILRDQFGKTIASLQSMNDTVKYEFGVDRDRYIHQGETILRGSLATIALFWNELAILHTPENDDFFEEPELIRMRQSITERLETIAGAVVRAVPIPVTSADLSASTALLASPRFGNYVRNVLSSFGELQNVIKEQHLQHQ